MCALHEGFASVYLGSLLYDAIVYAFVLWTTLRLRRARSCFTMSGNTGLASLIMRDGCIVCCFCLYLKVTNMRPIQVAFIFCTPPVTS